MLQLTLTVFSFWGIDAVIISDGGQTVVGCATCGGCNGWENNGFSTAITAKKGKSLDIIWTQFTIGISINVIFVLKKNRFLQKFVQEAIRRFRVIRQQIKQSLKIVELFFFSCNIYCKSKNLIKAAPFSEQIIIIWQSNWPEEYTLWLRHGLIVCCSHHIDCSIHILLNSMTLVLAETILNQKKMRA